MPLSDAQKEKIKALKDDERTELLDVLGIKPADDSSLAKTVELLQGEVASLKKAATRKGNEERRGGKGSSWFETVFGGG